MSVSSQPAVEVAGKDFAPSLSLHEVRKWVRSLNTEVVDDVLCLLAQGERAEMMKAAHVTEQYWGAWIKNLCIRKLHMQHEKKLVEYERAAVLMYHIYVTQGYRPNEKAEKFLHYMCGKIRDRVEFTGEDLERVFSVKQPLAASKEMPIPDTASTQKPVTAPQSALVQTDRDETTADVNKSSLVVSLRSRIKELGNGKMKFVRMIAQGFSREQMLAELQKTDVGADASSVEHGIGELLRTLGLSTAVIEEENFNSIRKACDPSGSLAVEEPVEPKSEPASTAISEPAAAPATEGEDDPATNSQDELPDTSGLVEGLSRYMEELDKARKVSAARVQILDALLTESDLRTVGTLVGKTRNAVSVTIVELRRLCQVPHIPHNNYKISAHLERDLMVRAWGAYRERQGVIPLQPATSPEPEPPVDPEESASAASSAETDPTPSSVEEAGPAPAPQPEPAVAEVPPVEPVVQEVQAEEPPLEAVQPPQTLPSEVQPTPPAHRPRLDMRAPSVYPKTPGRPNKAGVPGVCRFLLSSSATFEQDQEKALQDGFAPDQWEHLILPEQPAQVVTVLTLFKPSSN